MISSSAVRALKCKQLLSTSHHVHQGRTFPLMRGSSRQFGNGNLRCWHPQTLRIRASSFAGFSTTLSRAESFLKPRSCLLENTSPPRILAFSPSSANIMDKPSFLMSILQWCKEWLEAIWEAIQVSLRISEISLRLSPLLILSPAALAAAQFSDQPNPISNLAWEYLMAVVQALGPGYVKLCQWIATRRDVFPVVVCDRLSQLQDRGNPHSLSESHQILKKAFGGDYEDRGLHLEEVIGCGSAAQVYKATLTTRDESSGKRRSAAVAVKVLHPWFQRQLENDLWLMDTVAKWLHSLPSETIRLVNLPRAVHNFGGNLRRQADLTLEADNLKKFRLNFYGANDDASSSSILFPQPKEGWISEEVLVEDLVENSKSIAEFLNDSTELGLQTRKELAGPLLSAFLKMVFHDNFVHADIHPGNCLVQTKPTIQRRSTLSSNWFPLYFGGRTKSNDSRVKAAKHSIVFLDAGIVTSLSENDRRNLQDLFRAVVLNDGYEAGRLMVERAQYERCSQKEGGVEAFAAGVEEIVAEFHDRRKSGLTLGAVRIGYLLGKVLDLCRSHGVEIDPAMSSIVVSTLVLEGLGRSLEPSLNLMDCAVPFVLGRGTV